MGEESISHCYTHGGDALTKAILRGEEGEDG